MYRKRRWPAITAGYAAFVLALSAAAAFVYENSAPANRPVVVRLAVVVVLAVALIHLRRYFRGDPLWDPPSDFEKALTVEPTTTKLHPEFARLREEVANSAARRSSFERSLWPRLIVLARARGGHAANLELPPLPRRRGASLRLLADLISDIESRE